MEQRIDQPVPIPGTKLILGLFFTILGVLWTGENLRLLHADDFLRYWPAVVVLIGVRKLLDPTSRVAGSILTIVGASILGYTAGWVRFTIFDFWPLLLIAFGAVIVARALGMRLPVSTASDSSQIWSVFNVRKVKNTSRDYSGGGIFGFMGGCALDLTEADIVHSPAIIDAFVMWGGIEIYVPDRWEVIGEVVPFMAGFEMRTGPAGDPQRQLIVRGAAVMGGIEIKRRTS
jgi:cell wall-active antibiotic response 4TMS protein YvqF